MSIRPLIDEMVRLKKSKYEKSRAMRKAKVSVKTRGPAGKPVSLAQRKQREKAAKISAKRRKGKKTSNRKVVFE